MPIVLYVFKIFAISIFVPIPSVLATIFGFFIFFGILDIELKLPIFPNLLFSLFFFEILDIKLTNLSAAAILTPLFSYVNLFLFLSF